MYGSAAVIGSMMLPVLRPIHPGARDRAMELGVAFQLTNFLRDVAEDWDRGRIYLPLEDLERFQVDQADFQTRRVTPAFRRLLAFEIGRTRALYRRAEEGWAMLTPRSRMCIRVAHRLYAGILDEIEGADYQVFQVRAAVGLRRKVAVAGRELVRPSRGTQGAAAVAELVTPLSRPDGGGLRIADTPVKCDDGPAMTPPAHGPRSMLSQDGAGEASGGSAPAGPGRDEGE
jgi:phytoene synthase